MDTIRTSTEQLNSPPTCGAGSSCDLPCLSMLAHVSVSAKGISSFRGKKSGADGVQIINLILFTACYD